MSTSSPHLYFALHTMRTMKHMSFIESKIIIELIKGLKPVCTIRGVYWAWNKIFRERKLEVIQQNYTLKKSVAWCVK